MVDMNWIFIAVVVLYLLMIIFRRRRYQMLVQENEIRANLNLPPLIDSEFEVKPVEKSADYRGKINQHM